MWASRRARDRSPRLFLTVSVQPWAACPVETLLTSTSAVSQGVGRPLIGLASDRLGRINVAGLGTLVAGLAAFFLWTFAGTHYPGLIIYVLFGMFAGILWPCVAPVGAEVVGLQLLPAGMRSRHFYCSVREMLTRMSALSIYWLVLVLPATLYVVGSESPFYRFPHGQTNPLPSAEVIGLSLRTPGISGYLNVQAFTGTMFLVGFLSCMSCVSYETHRLLPGLLTFCAVWLLRSWKLQQLDLLGLDDKQEVADAQRRSGLVYSCLREMITIKRV